MMDRTIKERLVGAIVLVVLAVLVVPVFLDGPPQESEVIVETLALPGQEGQVTERKTIVLERNRSEPVPASANGAEPKPVAAEPEVIAEPPVKVVNKPVDKADEKPAETPVVPTATEGGLWAVQLGSFSNHENARKMGDELRKANYAAFESKLVTADGEQLRVRVGPVESREAAEALARKLKAAGYNPRVVSHP
jgi:DedD protein